MTRKVPTGVESVQVSGLGTLQGRSYADGVRQFFGVPYGRVAQRWTRAVLATDWPNGFHDGTKLGKHYPYPAVKDPKKDPRLPVREIPEFEERSASDVDCLNLNIAIPGNKSLQAGPLPVMVWIHGGAFYFGGNFNPIYDLANLVSYSVEQGMPIVAVSINYRLALGGFLASKEIQESLAHSGESGVGNFGLTDQQLALKWVQEYIKHFNGDPDNVTVFGESAGGISIAHQLAAAEPAKFRRAILMSGSLHLVANWRLERHQQRYDRLLKYLGIEAKNGSTLNQLRALSENALNEAALTHEPSAFPVYNPCDDGVFHASPPSLKFGDTLPSDVESIVVGDVLDEGELWRHVAAKQDFEFFRDRMMRYMSAAEADKIFALYGTNAETPKDNLTQNIIDMIADALFKMQTYVLAHSSPLAKTYAYHIDQKSTLENRLKGQAYHAIDLFYVFLNGREDMTPRQKVLAEKMALDWLKFANGQDPWETFPTSHRWMIYGPGKLGGSGETTDQDGWGLQSEDKDEKVRHYTRMERLINDNLYDKFWQAMEDIAYERYGLES